MNNDITFYKLNSPYPEDTTKNCGLSSAQIDENNMSLKEYDIKNINITGNTIQLTRVNGVSENVIITNTHIVSNLNADLLDGHHSSDFLTSNSLNGYVPTGRTINGYNLASNVTLNSHDVGSYTSGETDILINNLTNVVSTGQTLLFNLITGETYNRVTGDTNLQNIKVDKTQKINGYVLTGDTVISAHDVGSYTSGETNNLLGGYYTTGQTNTLLSGYVPTGTSINGQTLNQNITISAHDTGAYTSGETIGLITQIPGTSTGLTISQNGFTVYRNMLTTGTTVNIITGATISPSFSDDIYKVQTNYTSGNTVLVSGYTSMPAFDTCKNIVIKNIKNSVTIALQSTTLIQSGITYTFVFMGDNSVLLPTTKIMEISYLFEFNSSTTCDVSIIYIIQT